MYRRTLVLSWSKYIEIDIDDAKENLEAYMKD